MFKIVLIVAVIVFLGYQFFSAGNNGSVGEGKPMYGEARIHLNESGRNVDFVLVAKMTSAEDCQNRLRRIWTKALQSCTNCQFKSTECKAELSRRYKKLFDDQQLDTIYYLRAQRGNDSERDGRMVVWGLNKVESKEVCNTIKAHLKVNYQGNVACVPGL